MDATPVPTLEDDLPKLDGFYWASFRGDSNRGREIVHVRHDCQGRVWVRAFFMAAIYSAKRWRDFVGPLKEEK